MPRPGSFRRIQPALYDAKSAPGERERGGRGTQYLQQERYWGGTGGTGGVGVQEVKDVQEVQEKQVV